jgi:polynucleotide 5'-hydroxyl-kinase GRC3/NOL9
MSGKRKRDDLTTSGATSKAKPLSAIAAARLRAESAAKDITAPEIVHEPVSVPLHQPIPVSESEDDEAESEEQSLPVRRSSRLCNWRHELSDILSDTETELTINLKKHATIALIGCFDLKVLRGAVHINGANIGTVSHGGQKHKTYRIHVPATHPILKIRGLDSVNHVHFINCKQPTPLAGSSPMFADIWNAKPIGRPHRSFSIVSYNQDGNGSRTNVNRS